MKTIEASQFQDECLALLSELDTDGLIVTDGGKPIARVLPHNTGDSTDSQPDEHVDNSDLYGILRGKLEIKGDTMSTGVRWNAEDD